MKRILILFFLVVNISLAQDEFTPLGTFYPDFFAELLDAEIYSPTKVYTIGVGGFVFVDVSNVDKPEIIGRFSPGSIYKRFYNGYAAGTLALGAARNDGLYLIDISDMKQPQLIKIHKTSGLSYESVALKNDIVYAAAHENGVELLDINNPAEPQLISTLHQVENVWDVHVAGDYLYAADGKGGIQIYSISDPRNPVYLSSIQTTGQAKEIIISEPTAYISLGAAGFDLIDISDPANPVFLANFNPGFGITNHLDYMDGVVYLATWEMVMAVDVSNPLNPVLIGTEDTPGRSMGITAGNGYIYVSDWFTLKNYSFQALVQPDIHIKPAVYDFGFKELGQPISHEFEIFNLGEAVLDISDISLVNSQFEISDTSFSVQPGSSKKVAITYLATSSTNISKTVLFPSNDFDEPDYEIRLYAGSSGLSPGDPAPTFTLNDIDGKSFSLDDYRGKIVLLAFFASW